MKKYIERFEVYSKLATRKRLDGMSKANKKRTKRYAIEFFENASENSVFDDFISWLMGKDIAESTRATIAFNVGSFLNHLNLLNDSEYTKIKKYFRHPQKVWSNKILDQETIFKLVDMHLDSRYKLSVARNPLIICFFATTGMRVRQLVDLEFNDVIYKPTSNYIEIRLNLSKESRTTLEPTKDIKTIPTNIQIGRYDIDTYIYRYINLLQQKFREAPKYFFVNNGGGKLSTAYIRSKIVKKGDINLTTHTFRHYVATQIANKHGIHKASIMLGHKAIGTTMRYINPETVDTRELVADIYKGEEL